MRYRSKKQRKFSASLSMVEDSLEDHLTTNASGIHDTSKTKVLDSMIKELQQRNSLIKCDEASDISDLAKQRRKSETEIGLVHRDSFASVDEGLHVSEKNLHKLSPLDRAKKLMEVRIYSTKTLPKRIANIKKQRSKTLKETSRFYTDLLEETAKPAPETLLKITETSDNIPVEIAEEVTEENSLEIKNAIVTEDNDAVKQPSDATTNSPQAVKNSKNKRDIDIISDLLKDHKDFDRILKKPPKKSLLDIEKSHSSHEMKHLKFLKNDPFLVALNARSLSLPAGTAPPDKLFTQRLSGLQKEVTVPEPIYESLLRNVHVPYKFPSPVLNRSMSQPHYKFLKVKRPMEAPPKRPDSDYVTLAYADGELNGVDGQVILPKHKNFHLRNSDTNINYNDSPVLESDTQTSVTQTDSGLSEGRYRGSISSETDSSFGGGGSSGGSISLKTANTKSSGTLTSTNSNSVSKINADMDNLYRSVDSLNLGKHLAPKLPERRVSDVTGMYRQSIIHKQGSKALGSRIATLEYADPKTLFTHHNHNQTLINTISIQNQLQRDSVFSLTSSNDSVNTTGAANESNTTITSTADVSIEQQSTVQVTSMIRSELSYVTAEALATISSNDDSYYEKNVENCLEDNGIFRDSAVYSDDNEKQMQTENIYSTIVETTKTVSKPVPPPKYFQKASIPPPIILRTAPPPPLPAKPAFIVKNERKSETGNKFLPTSSASSTPPASPSISMVKTPTMKTAIMADSNDTISPPPLAPRMNKPNSSWVSRQIKNFEK